MTTTIQTVNKPESRTFRNILQIVGGALAIALCSQIKIPLGFTPVPLTLQTFAVLAIGVTLGSRKGALAALGYLAMVSCGLPVLAGGAVKPLALMGVTGGYLAGFLPEAFIAGLSRELASKKRALLFGLLAASSVQMAMGTAWLATFFGWGQAAALGLYPFIAGEVLKCLAIAGGAKLLHRSE